MHPRARTAADGSARLYAGRAQCLRRSLEVAFVDRDEMQPRPEECHAPSGEKLFQGGSGALRFIGRDLEEPAGLRGLDRGRRTFRHHAPGRHEAEPMAVLGFFQDSVS